ncbi:putative helicase HelY [bacterium HR40]|nr:putative helicase HelY [bacterium HR40]
MSGGGRERGRVVAVLGPTNTGKTHFAVERMLAHESGVMGFPLRLLAREIYDRIVALKGASLVALVTGEERIGRPDAPYVVATVEAMPMHRRFAFLAVDEIQLCADRERGHIFTDRLLRARGSQETMFLGSDTIRPLLRHLVPEAEIVTRPRFSTLTYTGPARLDRLPRRSAIVAFTAADVYALAEIIRRRKGGAAVVLGALSPRTRNAQVAMYQAGEVEHLVATDAIGMGLNMDLAHVAFASLRKFDGEQVRALTAAEVAQIAGRAGRHMADGSFGVTNGLGELDPRLVEAVENHHFPPLRALRWRNAELDFSSLQALAASLDRDPPSPGLRKVRNALDDRSLALLSTRAEIRARADRPERVRLLWDVCQIPDFRKTLTEAHLELLRTVFDQLTGPRGRLATDWMARMVDHLDRTDGDIDSLVARLSHIRTFTYLAHRPDWLVDAAHWQERTRAVEDRLSDALHARLTQRFVDRRTTALLRQLRERGELESHVERQSGEVLVDGRLVGRIEGLRFLPQAVAGDLEARMVARAARRAVGRELRRRLGAIEQAGPCAFTLVGHEVHWEGAAIARLARGPSLLRPLIELLLAPEIVDRGTALKARIENWLATHFACVLAPLEALQALSDSPEASGSARGLAFQLAEAAGLVPREQVDGLLAGLTTPDRRLLTRLGVRFGVHHVYVAPLLRPAAIEARARLLAIWTGAPVPVPSPGCTVLRGLPQAAREWALQLGFVPVRDFALRVDLGERLAARLRALARRHRRFPLPPELAAEAGLTREELEGMARALGFRPTATSLREGTGPLWMLASPRRRPKSSKAPERDGPPDSERPFAALAGLRVRG